MRLKSVRRFYLMLTAKVDRALRARFPSKKHQRHCNQNQRTPDCAHRKCSAIEDGIADPQHFGEECEKQ
jgi:hypothetical protein